MSNLEQIRSLSPKERRALSYDELVTLIRNMTSDEIMEVSKLIGYAVFARLCMGELKHKFVLLQDGAAAIILNSQNQILLQRRSDSGKWGLPGGCQELGERFQDTIIREIKQMMKRHIFTFCFAAKYSKNTSIVNANIKRFPFNRAF